MITASHLSVRIGARLLVADASFRIDKGDKVGFVGRNGAGKTTTMTLLAGRVDDEGAIEYDGQIGRRGTLAYLEQNPDTGARENTGLERIMAVRGLDALAARIRRAEEAMATSEGEALAKAMERYARADHDFDQAGGWAAKSEALHIAANLGLGEATLSQPLPTLSGGQRRRVELARCLFSGADTLLLDEPTNHLDHDSIVWLRDFIRSYSGGVLIISHSVDLLRETVNQVLYLDATRACLDVYNMGWDAYVRQRSDDERRRRRERANAVKKAEALRAQGEKMRAKATKAVAAQQMLRRAQELLDGLEPETSPDKVARLRFPTPAACGKVPLSAQGLAKSYGSLEVFAGVDLAIDRGSKVVVLGMNGAGKTTLLRLLVGIEEPDAGTVVAGSGLKVGYYAQEHETLDVTRSVYGNLAAVAPDLDETHVRNILGQFLFSGADADKPAAVLSGGEKTRLALATLVTSAANVLLLDEPTNNLDPASREEILQALRSYAGAVVLVTHDPGAVEALAPDRVLILPDGDEDLWSEEYIDYVTLT